MEDHEFKPDPSGNRWHSINGLETFYLTEKIVTQKKFWEQSPLCSNVNMPVLLYGFFNFYCNVFPQQTVAASIRLGEMSLQKTSFKGSSKLWRMCIEDCFETYYSHCPHDLGCHLKERGQEQMLDHFDQMTNDLGYLLRQENATEEMVNTFVRLFFSDTDSKPKTQQTKSTFKGKCDNCHQVGHKSKKGQDKSNFRGRCNNCQQTGHKKVDCPLLENMNGHDKNRATNHQKNNGGHGGGDKNTRGAVHANKKFIQQQEERLRQISVAKQKESKHDHDVEEGEEKTQKQKKSRRRHRKIQQT